MERRRLVRIWRAGGEVLELSERERVVMARTMKLVPPAKSVVKKRRGG
jgi:hypothetical protein